MIIMYLKSHFADSASSELAAHVNTLRIDFDSDCTAMQMPDDICFKASAQSTVTWVAAVAVCSQDLEDEASVDD